MDAVKLDRLSRTLATERNRRGAFRLAAAALVVGGLGAAPAAAAGRRHKRCRSPLHERCGKGCVNLMTSDDHCGSCGHACSSAPPGFDTCRHGNCCTADGGNCACAALGSRCNAHTCCQGSNLCTKQGICSFA